MSWRQALLAVALVGALGLARAQPCPSGQTGTPGPNARLATWFDQDYTGPSVSAHCGQRYNVFLPDGPEPPDGWPVLIVLDNGGFRSSSRREYIDPDQPADARAAISYEALTNTAMPMVVVYASCTVSRGGASGNPVDDADYAPWDTPASYGPAYKGNGVFIPPGVTPPGYADPLAPYVDPDRPMPEKDAVMLIQHVKHNVNAFPPGQPGAVRLDASRLAVSGASGGAILLMWCVLGPDRALQTFPTPVPGSQEETGTRVPAAVLDSGSVLFRRIVQYSIIGNLPTGLHMPLVPGSAGTLYDQPATLLGDNPAKQYQDEASALIYGDDGLSGEVSTLNSQQLLYLSYSNPSSIAPPLCFDKDAQTGLPSNCWFQTGQEQNIHSSWHGHAWKRRFGNTFLVTTLNAAYDTQGMAVLSENQPDALPDRILPNGASREDFAQDQVSWLAAALAGESGTWNNLGQALPGTHGQPQLQGFGSLKPDSPVSIVLSNALEQAPTAIVIGFSRIDQPLLAGTLVPMPDIVDLGQPFTDASGRQVLSSLWPPGLTSNTNIYIQTWILDPGGWAGWASSNALQAVTP